MRSKHDSQTVILIPVYIYFEFHEKKFSERFQHFAHVSEHKPFSPIIKRLIQKTNRSRLIEMKIAK